MKKMLRKKRENRKVADRGCSKLRKLEGNPNITSKRLTIPPGFLGLGVKSETIRKSSDKEEFPKEKDFILNGNLHGLFNTCLKVNPVNVRRSERILKKKFALNTSSCSASEYYDKVINERKILESESTPINKEKSLFQNKSKSLFREINEKYNARAECLNTNFNILTPPQDSHSTDSSEEEVTSRKINNSDFCKNLFREVHLNLGHKTLLDCKSRIIAKIQRINCVISGKVDPETIMEREPYTLVKNINDGDCEEVNFQYVPKSQWVYDTPPRQRIHVQKAEECQMRPAVLCSTRKQTNIYEMKTNSKIDLNNCSNRQDVELDDKFLKRVGSFQHRMNGDDEFRKKNCFQINRENGISPCNFYLNRSEPSGSVDNSFCLVQPVPDNPFYNLVSRPRKTVKTDHSLHNVIKRKLNQKNYSDDPLFLNQPSSSHQACKQSQNISFTEGRTFYSSNAQTPKFNFDFKRKLFVDTEAKKKFCFNNDKSNLFDFSQ